MTLSESLRRDGSIVNLQPKNATRQVRLGRSVDTIADQNPGDWPGVSGEAAIIGGRGIQYWSALMTSEPLTEPSARQVLPVIVFLMNRTPPSPNKTFTPPG